MPNASAHAKNAPKGTSSLYRAVWRWHFYAGLFVLPFMILLAVTGAAYLFRDEIDDWVYSDLKFVNVLDVPPLPISTQVDAVRYFVGDKPVKIITPTSPDRSTEIVIATSAGDRRSVYVDPYTGLVLGSMPDRGTIMWLIRRIHSLAEFGTVTNYLIEIAAGWSILLVATGTYLWWPRGNQNGGVLTVRDTPARRRWWRDAHAVTGIFVGFFIVFLAATGMFWSVFWGKYANEFANGTPSGYPSGVRVDVPLSTVPMIKAFGETGWTTENAQIPLSVDGTSTANGGTPTPFGIDAAVAKFAELGIAPGYAISLPSSETGVYSASIYPDDLSQQRVIHLDQYSGRPLIDMGYQDYGIFGRIMEWAINVHMGQEYGVINQIVLMIVCAAIVFMAVSGGMMWWKRRPAGSLGIPPLPRRTKSLVGVTAILGIGGIIYPVVGVSMLVIWFLDWLFVARPARALRVA
ncbi:MULTISPECIES: PepSY-associated TM helix domain-containing protein [Thalassospira]|jgi:uncharacterized iron-regulated membrane protein|uniref:PepSY domain-containing protein n=2 Tax=Thalassospira TaxID=168934 RepID=A0ABR5Y3H0_9PROT|nr:MULTISPECIES: PepSY domain-containing protein [Thalassospira]MAL30514.1 PepSY domain-containing protein [Thalassospira sp.]MBR9782080.1 PepSY domain-containing protein [Rhodospirillales bacterium]KZD04535.1 hypothetical protein AUP40_15005 [Thalassospira xiamenensis]KZD10453.1 hypothetical protein AUP45_11770 [Thalassospira xiamenensis]MBL4840940.1 PepSY domain-containing protein [Thalassospira sp.]|tara:strand:+ start:3966 stop:5351 length:1386 start_codon:yes stop_codon:yes gene_type:complete